METVNKAHMHNVFLGFVAVVAGKLVVSMVRNWLGVSF